MIATLPVAQTRIVANELAAKLSAAEAAIDAAVAAVAGLTAAMPIASQQSNVGMHIGHEALMHAMESCSALVKARTNIIRSHKALAVAQHEVGLGDVAFLDTNCPESASANTTVPAVRHLAAVA
jgi:hypothetical protein